MEYSGLESLGAHVGTPCRRGLRQPAVHHLECITALELVDYIFPMLVSGSRDGVIKVWR